VFTVSTVCVYVYSAGMCLGRLESAVHMDHLENRKPLMSSANQTPEPLWCSMFFVEFFVCETILVQCQSYSADISAHDTL
jgi:hypothetical protein